MTKAKQTTTKVERNRKADTIEATWQNASERERRATENAESRYLNRSERLRVQVEKTATGFKTDAAKGGIEASLALRLADAMGTTSPAFSDATLSNIATLIGSCSHGGVNSRDVSAALAVLDGMQPENEVEAMLLAQMWATNESAMRSLAMIGKSDWINQTAMFGNLAVKLLRTYAAQIEALAKLRRKGEQTVKVVHVYPGGQAIVANTVNSGGGQDDKTNERSDATGAAGVGPALLGQDAEGLGVPVPSREWPEAVQDARRHESRPA